MDKALVHLPIVRINEKTRESLLHGGPIGTSGIQELSLPIKEKELVRVHNSQDRLLAVARALFDIGDLKKVEKEVVVFKPVRVIG